MVLKRERGGGGRYSERFFYSLLHGTHVRTHSRAEFQTKIMLVNHIGRKIIYFEIKKYEPSNVAGHTLLHTYITTFVRRLSKHHQSAMKNIIQWNWLQNRVNKMDINETSDLFNTGSQCTCLPDISWEAIPLWWCRNNSTIFLFILFYFIFYLFIYFFFIYLLFLFVIFSPLFPKPAH